MKLLEFRQHFKKFNVITYQDIRNAFGVVNKSQLYQWRKNKHLISVRRGMYVLSGCNIDSLLMANELNDSYISLESALSYYQMIPEIVQTVTSVSKDRQKEISNDFGNFCYHKIVPKLFTGFTLIKSNVKENRFIRMAEPEKAIFDLVYFRSDLKEKRDFESLRLILEKLKVKKMKKYIRLVKAKRIKSRLNNFLQYYYAVI